MQHLIDKKNSSKSIYTDAFSKNLKKIWVKLLFLINFQTERLWVLTPSQYSTARSHLQKKFHGVLECLQMCHTTFYASTDLIKLSPALKKMKNFKEKQSSHVKLPLLLNSRDLNKLVKVWRKSGKSKLFEKQQTLEGDNHTSWKLWTTLRSFCT